MNIKTGLSTAFETIKAHKPAAIFGAAALSIAVYSSEGDMDRFTSLTLHSPYDSPGASWETCKLDQQAQQIVAKVGTDMDAPPQTYETQDLGGGHYRGTHTQSPFAIDYFKATSEGETDICYSSNNHMGNSFFAMHRTLNVIPTTPAITPPGATAAL